MLILFELSCFGLSFFGTAQQINISIFSGADVGLLCQVTDPDSSFSAQEPQAPVRQPKLGVSPCCSAVSNSVASAAFHLCSKAKEAPHF